MIILHWIWVQEAIEKLPPTAFLGRYHQRWDKDGVTKPYKTAIDQVLAADLIIYHLNDTLH